MYHSSWHDKLHKDVSSIIDVARTHIEKESFNDVKHAYDTIRSIYSKLSPEGKRRIHGDIIKLKEDIVKKFYRE